MTVYKIRRKSDGLFALGGDRAAFGPKGKTWSGLGPLKNHLIGVAKANLWRNGVTSLGGRNLYVVAAGLYAGCEVVAYELVEPVEGAVVPVERFAEPA